MTALAWTLVHFLWQGTLIALAAALLLRRPALAASTRYLIGVGALALMLVAPLATFVAESAWRADDDLRRAVASVMKTEVVVYATWPSAAQTPPAPPAPEVSRGSGAVFIVLPWAAGVTVLLIRLLGGWVVARAVAGRASQPVGADVQAMVVRLSGRLALDRAVRVFESASVVVPVVIGWMRPVVLVPTAALAGLPPAQLEALLAHELAHVRRHDYLVNLLQAVVETLLFYHPGVWWVSRQVRAEREHCCDDIAVSVCDRVDYVSALSSLAAIAAPPRLALAATDGRLVSRVRRLLSRAPEQHGAASIWLSAAVAITLVASIPVAMAAVGWTTARPDAADPSAAGPSPIESPAPVRTSAPQGANAAAWAPSAAGDADAPGPGQLTEIPASRPVLPGGVVVEAQHLEVVGRGEVTVQQVPAARSEAETLKVAAQLRLMEAQLTRVEQERRATEAAQIQRKFELEREGLGEEIAQARSQAERVKRQYEIGLAGQDAVAEAQARLQAVERRVKALEAEREFAQKQSTLDEQRRRTMDEYDRLQREYAVLLGAREEAAIAEKIRRNRQEFEERAQADREPNVASQAQLQRQAAERLQAAATQREREREVLTAGTREIEQARNREELARRSREAELRAAAPELAERVREMRARQLITDPAATVRVGDVVTVEIRGETDVPTSYTIAAAGTIRLPFMEPVKVVGLTRAQIQAALITQLKRVKSDVALEVAIRRQRERRSLTRF